MRKELYWIIMKKILVRFPEIDGNIIKENLIK